MTIQKMFLSRSLSNTNERTNEHEYVFIELIISILVEIYRCTRLRRRIVVHIYKIVAIRHYLIINNIVIRIRLLTLRCEQIVVDDNHLRKVSQDIH
jgi:hypothetical protein